MKALLVLGVTIFETGFMLFIRRLRLEEK